MPWFPDFVSAAELVRLQDRDEGRADPVGQYLRALAERDEHVLESAWPGQVVVYDPKVGEVTGHKALRHFVRENESWLAGLHAHTETIASTHAGGRAVVEILAHLTVNGQPVTWPIAVVAESPDDLSVVFRTYCSQWPVDGRRHVRPPVLSPGPAQLPDVVGRFQVALTQGDLDAVLATFAADGYYREPIGPHATHRGPDELRAFFTAAFSDGGGIGLQD